MNVWQLGTWIVGIIGGLVAATVAIAQQIQNRRQRERELRWKQAECGKKLIDEIFHDPYSNAATLMLDSWQRSYSVPDAGKMDIDWDDHVRPALNVDSWDNEDPKSSFVRDSFDMLFYLLDRFECLLQVELTTFE